MLLKNSPSEYKLVNGSIGIVKEIILKHSDGPRHILYELPACVIVEFKESNFFWNNKMANWKTQKCHFSYSYTHSLREKCCTVTSIPLRIYKVITIHKAQGMIIEPGKRVW